MRSVGRRAAFGSVANRGELTEWGVLGALVGKLTGSYWEVPVIEGLAFAPTSDDLKHMGAAMASFGSIPLFHLPGITPEASSLAAVGAEHLPVEEISDEDLQALRANYGSKGDKVDVVVFAAPQLSLVEMQRVAGLCAGRPSSHR